MLRIIVLCKNIRGRGGIKDLNILCFDYSSRLLFVNFNYTQKFNKGKDFICFFFYVTGTVFEEFMSSWVAYTVSLKLF